MDHFVETVSKYRGGPLRFNKRWAMFIGIRRSENLSRSREGSFEFNRSSRMKDADRSRIEATVYTLAISPLLETAMKNFEHNTGIPVSPVRPSNNIKDIMFLYWGPSIICQPGEGVGFTVGWVERIEGSRATSLSEAKKHRDA